jgi:16S rRNA (guanine527-N7)-methyltransferase
VSLLAVLERAQALGFLGPGPVERHLAQAEAFVAALPAPPRRVLDLGSGGGVPGLVLVERWPDTGFVLADAQQRRTDFLSEAVAELGVADRVSVRTGRAEVLGREAGLRASFDAVVARSFGAPAVTAECAAPFLQVSGLLLVAEPPVEDPERWPANGAALLGLVDEGVVRVPGGGVRRLRLVAPVEDRFPRRDGVPGRRPLF